MYERQSLSALGSDRAAREEAVGETYGTELEAAGREGFAAFADEHLGRAATDVDEDQPLIERRHGLQHSEVDEPCLFQPGDDLDLDLGFAARPVQEHVGVLGFAYCAGRDGAYGSVVRRGDALHSAQRRDAPVDRVGGEHLHVTAAMAEAHGLLLAGDDLVAVVEDPGDHEVEAVGADVERREGGRTGGCRHGVMRSWQACMPPSTPARNASTFSKALPFTLVSAFGSL